MKTCPNCGNQISVDTVKFCYECGYKFSDEAGSQNNQQSTDSFSDSFSGFNFDFGEISEDTNATYEEISEINDTASSFDFSSLGNVNSYESTSQAYDDGVIDSGLIIKNGVLLEYKGKNKRVTIPSTVTKIADEAFYMNDYVESVIIGTNVKEIGDEAFIECKDLRMASLPEGLKKIGRGAFAFNERLTVVDIPRSVIEFGENAFENTGMSSVVIPKGVEVVNEGAFRICNNLKKVTICEGVKTIGTNAFELCESLTEISLPSSLRTIEHGAFTGTGISSISLPEGLLEIDSYAFFECVNLKEIKIPKSVKRIEGDAFVSCTSLKKIYVPRHLNFEYEYSKIKAEIVYY